MGFDTWVYCWWFIVWAMYYSCFGFIKVAVSCGVCSVLDVYGLPVYRLLGVGFGYAFLVLIQVAGTWWG